MKLITLTFLLLPCTLLAQDLASQKRSHQGLFLQVVQSKQVFKNSFATASSKFKTGLAIGFYQHFDLGARFQLRIGGGLSAYQVDERDYSPVFGLDIDPGSGIDIKKSYVDNKADILQFNIPLNVRYKLWGSARHGFAAIGAEGRYVVADDIKAYIQESGLSHRMIDHSPFYESRAFNFAAHLEFGYEFEINQSRKMHVSILAKHSLLTQFDDDFHGSAFYHILNSRALDIGVGMGVVF
jgi:hypothetical protein